MNDLIELGKRAAACKHWRWMPGMRTVAGFQILDSLGGGYLQAFWPVQLDWSGGQTDRIICEEHTPDLSDSATLGCLLHLVRLTYGNMQICATNKNHVNWDVLVNAGPDLVIISEDCGSEAEALVSALEQGEGMA